MSDPTIQTFCCHHTGNKEDMAVKIMDEFNTQSYNTVCLVSSTIGILGSIYQWFYVVFINSILNYTNWEVNKHPTFLTPSHPRLRPAYTRFWRFILAPRYFTGLRISSSNVVQAPFAGATGIFPCILPNNLQERYKHLGATRGRRIIIWLAVADLLASFGVLVRSSLWLRYKNIMPMPNDDVSVLFCSLTSAWTQYFYTVTWFWTLFYAIDTWLAIKGRDSHQLLYHSFAWGFPIATTGIGLSILYLPNAKCHNLTSVTSALYKILPNYCATYLPIAMVMIVNPIMYLLSSKNVEMAVALPLAQFTSKERRVVDALRLKFFLINVVFYVCWLPNLINGILVWTMWFQMPVKVIITIWYIMALINPMQALLNALVYRKWNTHERSYRVAFSTSQKEFNFLHEQSPLLGSEPPRLQMSSIPPPNINNYASM